MRMFRCCVKKPECDAMHRGSELPFGWSIVERKTGDALVFCHGHAHVADRARALLARVERERALLDEQRRPTIGDRR